MKPGEAYKKKKFRVSDRIKSFRNAFSGISVLVRYEHNARIHLVILILVISAGLLFHLRTSEWISIIFAAGFVFMSESFNTAIEYLSDVVSPEHNEKIGIAKDLAAAAVMISVITSVMVGLIVFIPKIIRLFGQ
jgi:diacylglycerol kinase (ATP)